MSYARLLEDWEDLLGRRPAFRASLALYRPILEAWTRWSGGRVAPIVWSASECRACWERRVPLLAESSISIPSEAMEDLLSQAIGLLVAIGAEDDALRRFAEAWDRGEIGPSDLFPGRGRVGSASAQERAGLSQEFLSFLAYASLRPILEAYFEPCRPHGEDSAWDLGTCPFCGGPPSFADLAEDGRRVLWCHLCGAGWAFSRLRCPYCGNRSPRELTRFQAEDKEEGYQFTACGVCRGYVKELDRRVRWNARSALVEDWGSPHLDLVANRAGYWRAVPTLIELRRPPSNLTDAPTS